MNNHCPKDYKQLSVRVVRLLLNAENAPSSSSKEKEIVLCIALFPPDLFSLAKQFWQHTGLGISSRTADRCLTLLESPNNNASSKSQPMSFSPRNSRYSADRLSRSRNHSLEEDSGDHLTYLEERYGRNMPISDAVDAKRTLRRRIAGVLAQEDGTPSSPASQVLHPSLRGENVTEQDVYLFPTGMSAIWAAHQLCLAALPPGKSVCFGYVSHYNFLLL